MRLILIILFLVSPSVLRANFYNNIAAGYYVDDERTSRMTKISFTTTVSPFSDDQGFESAFGLGYSVKELRPVDQSASSLEAIGGNSQLFIHSGDFSYQQGLGIGKIIGANISLQESEVNKVRSYGLSYTHWFLSETIRATVGYNYVDLEQDQQDFTDTDGRRVVTPSDVAGHNVNFDYMHYLSKTTIGMANLSLTTRPDRPNAWGVGAEVRQYFKKFNAAAHLAYSHYANVGTLRPITNYGEITAHSIRFEWHQKLLGRFVLAPGYRFHVEVETPRAELSSKERHGSDYFFTDLKYRLKAHAWTLDSTEFNFFVGKYLSNQPHDGWMFSLGSAFKF